MIRKFRFLDPEMIMGVVVALVILAVGVFAFFVTLQSIGGALNEIKQEEAQRALHNITGAENSMLDIIGIVLIIGAIMLVVGLVASYFGPSADRPKKRERPRREYRKHAVINLDDPGPYTKDDISIYENIKEEKTKKTKKQHGSFEEWK